MPLPNPTTAPCVAAPPGSGGPGASDTLQCTPTTTDPQCSDREWAADHPTECPGSAALVGLEVLPANQTVEVGASIGYTANLLFSFGPKQDVTAKALWATGDPLVAALNTDPRFVGFVQGAAEGATTVSATYRGWSDTSGIKVIAKCVGVFRLDIVLVIDRSASMLKPEFNSRSRMENTLRAAAAFAMNLDYSKDRVSVVSFGGTVYVRTDPSITPEELRKPDSTLHLALSTDLAAVLTALDDIDTQVNRCGQIPVEPIPDYKPVWVCCTGIGNGMEVAGAQLRANARLEPDVRKVIVLLTDGQENICQPDPDFEAAALKNENVTLVVISAGVPDAAAEACPDNPAPIGTTFARMRSWTSCGLFFHADSAEDLPSIYATLPHNICQQINEGSCVGYYYVFTPEVPPVTPPTPAVDTLEILPSSGDLYEGVSFSTRVFLVTAAKRYDVTGEAGTVFTPSSGLTASGGGKWVPNAGTGGQTASVKADYQGLTVTGNYEVKARCAKAPLYIVIACDVSGSMIEPANASTSRIGVARQAILDLLRSALPADDRVGLVTFSGYRNGTYEARQLAYFASPTDPMWPGLLDQFVMGGNGTAMGGGLSGAEAMFTALKESGQAPGNAQRVVLLLTDGADSRDGCAAVPPPAQWSQDLQSKHGAFVATCVMAPDGPDECNQNTTIYAVNQAIASSPDLFFPSPKAEDVPPLYGRILQVICAKLP